MSNNRTAALWRMRDDYEAAQVLIAELHVSREQAYALIDMAVKEADGLSFVAEVRLHTAAHPAGWHGDATKYLLEQVNDGWVLRLMQRHVTGILRSG